MEKIFRLPDLLPGQTERPMDEHFPDVRVRSAVPGSPERAFMASPYCPNYNDKDGVEVNVIAKLENGELTSEDVFVRLLTADEIAENPAYQGGRDHAFATDILVLR